jgi:hypothetical protein
MAYLERHEVLGTLDIIRYRYDTELRIMCLPRADCQNLEVRRLRDWVYIVFLGRLAWGLWIRRTLLDDPCVQNLPFPVVSDDLPYVEM